MARRAPRSAGRHRHDTAPKSRRIIDGSGRAVDAGISWPGSTMKSETRMHDNDPDGKPSAADLLLRLLPRTLESLPAAARAAGLSPFTARQALDALIADRRARLCAAAAGIVAIAGVGR